MGFSRQEYWSGLPFPSPEDLSDPEIKSGSSSLQAVLYLQVKYKLIVIAPISPVDSWSLDGGCFHGESELEPHLFCSVPDLKIFHGYMRQEMKRGEKQERKSHFITFGRKWTHISSVHLALAKIITEKGPHPRCI